jgi:hypothetical protein
LEGWILPVKRNREREIIFVEPALSSRLRACKAGSTPVLNLFQGIDNFLIGEESTPFMAGFSIKRGGRAQRAWQGGAFDHPLPANSASAALATQFELKGLADL